MLVSEPPSVLSLPKNRSSISDTGIPIRMILKISQNLDLVKVMSFFGKIFIIYIVELPSLFFCEIYYFGVFEV